MANPVTVNCPKKEWTKVASAKTLGTIWLNGNFFSKGKAYFVFQDAGGSTPTLYPGESGSTAIAIKDEILPFESTVAIDIFLWPPSADIVAVVSAE